MFLTGFADEAADAIEGQIEAIKKLGWGHIELRSVNKKNITDISDEEFDHVADQLETAKIKVNAFGSTIANWGKSILTEDSLSMEEVTRAIPRMQRLGVKYVRIMSYGIIPDRDPSDQLFEERVVRVQKIVDTFAEAGLQALHENCANYGGMGWPFTMKLLERVKGLRLIFDTANAGISLDRSKKEPYQPQDAWEFYSNVREFIDHVHIKDGTFISEAPGEIFEKADYVWAGEGNGQVKRIVSDLVATGYDGGLSMEPHMAVVFHDDSAGDSSASRMDQFVEYGKRFEALLNDIRTS